MGENCALKQVKCGESYQNSYCVDNTLLNLFDKGHRSGSYLRIPKEQWWTKRMVGDHAGAGQSLSVWPVGGVTGGKYSHKQTRYIYSNDLQPMMFANTHDIHHLADTTDSVNSHRHIIIPL